MLSRGMRDKPIEVSQGSPSPKVGGGGEGATTRRVRLSQSFFINATSKLVTIKVTGHTWLIDSTFQ